MQLMIFMQANELESICPTLMHFCEFFENGNVTNILQIITSAMLLHAFILALYSLIDFHIESLDIYLENRV